MLSCSTHFPVHHRVHSSTPLVHAMSHINQSTLFNPIPLRSILIVSSHLHLGFQGCLFPHLFPTKSLYISSCVLHVPSISSSVASPKQYFSPHHSACSVLYSPVTPQNKALCPSLSTQTALLLHCLVHSEPVSEHNSHLYSHLSVGITSPWGNRLLVQFIVVTACTARTHCKSL